MWVDTKKIITIEEINTYHKIWICWKKIMNWYDYVFILLKILFFQKLEYQLLIHINTSNFPFTIYDYILMVFILSILSVLFFWKAYFQTHGLSN